MIDNLHELELKVERLIEVVKNLRNSQSAVEKELSMQRKREELVKAKLEKLLNQLDSMEATLEQIQT